MIEADALGVVTLIALAIALFFGGAWFGAAMQERYLRKVGL